MKKRDLEQKLKAIGFIENGGSKHAKWTYGNHSVMVPRHKEINENTAKAILRQAELIVNNKGV